MYFQWLYLYLGSAVLLLVTLLVADGILLLVVFLVFLVFVALVVAQVLPLVLEEVEYEVP